MKEIEICQLTDSDSHAWNQYVNQSNDATFFHLEQWRTIFEQALRHRAYYLVAKIDNVITGIFPLVHVKSKLFGNALMSVPFGVYGGALADNESIKLEI